jgi:hypothetical protein
MIKFHGYFRCSFCVWTILVTVGGTLPALGAPTSQPTTQPLSVEDAEAAVVAASESCLKTVRAGPKYRMAFHMHAAAVAREKKAHDAKDAKAESRAVDDVTKYAKEMEQLEHAALDADEKLKDAQRAVVEAEQRQRELVAAQNEEAKRQAERRAADAEHGKIRVRDPAQQAKVDALAKEGLDIVDAVIAAQGMEQASVAKSGMGLSFDEAFAGLNRWFRVKRSPLRDGTPRILGESNASLIEYVGPEGNIRKAFLMLAADDRAEGAAGAGEQILTVFLTNTIPPEHAEQAGTWLAGVAALLPKQPKAKKEATFGGRHVEVYLMEPGFICVCVRAK